MLKNESLKSKRFVLLRNIVRIYLKKLKSAHPYLVVLKCSIFKFNIGLISWITRTYLTLTSYSGVQNELEINLPSAFPEDWQIFRSLLSRNRIRVLEGFNFNVVDWIMKMFNAQEKMLLQLRKLKKCLEIGASVYILGWWVLKKTLRSFCSVWVGRKIITDHF